MKYKVTIHYETEYNLTDHAEELEILRKESGTETLERWQIIDFLSEKFCELVDTDIVFDNLDIEEVEL